MRPGARVAVQRILAMLARRHAVEVFCFANGGYRIHLLLRASSRAGFQAFLRAFAGLVARHITGAKKGNPTGKFWDGLAYSRVLNWGAEFDKVRALVESGDLEALDAISRPQRRPTRDRVNAGSGGRR